MTAGAVTFDVGPGGAARLLVRSIGPEGDVDVREVAIRPGDALLVGRRRGVGTALRGFLRIFGRGREANVRGPIAELWAHLVSRRIQSTTGSPWNHVALVVDDHGLVAEAGWSGVSLAGIAREYPTRDYRLAVVAPPTEVDRAAAVRLGFREAARKTRYDWRWIALIRVATLLFGPSGYRALSPRALDEWWICSELVAAAWFGETSPRLSEFVVPADFSAAPGLEPRGEVS